MLWFNSFCAEILNIWVDNFAQLHCTLAHLGQMLISFSNQKVGQQVK